MANILILDDDASLAASVNVVLRKTGADYVVISTVRHLLDEVEIAGIDVVVNDCMSGGIPSITVAFSPKF